MLKADKHLHSNEKLIGLKKQGGASEINLLLPEPGLMLCSSEVNQTVSDLLIKNLIQNRWKARYKKSLSDFLADAHYGI